MNDAANLWNSVLEKLKLLLSEVTTMQFFGGTVGVSVSDTELQVRLAEGQNGVILQQQFGMFIANAVKDVSKRTLRIVFLPPLAPEEVEKVVEDPKRQATSLQKETGLQSKFTFDNFVNGPNNLFPVTMATYVAKHPGDESNHTNPFFMYGPTGVGKTHLLHAIGNLALSEGKISQVLYTTSENLMNDYIRSWQNDTTKEAFRKKYRTADMLLVDDIQYLTGKKGLQDEFFAIFNELTSHQRQIVMTSDRMPKEISDLMDRLVTRFESGVTADVDMPAFETRVNILKMKMKEFNVTLSNDVINFLAERVTSSVRSMEGALSSTVNYARCLPPGTPISLEALERSILRNFIEKEASIQQISCSDVQRSVCDHFKIKIEDLLGTSKLREFVVPRQVAIFLCRKLTTGSTTDIGKAFKRNHSTIIHSCSAMQDSMKQGNSDIVSILKSITATLNRSLSDLN